MIAIEKDSTSPTFVPDYLATSIEDIDFVLLARQGIKYVAFDADSTLVPYRGIELTPQTAKFLKKQKKLFSSWCIASNRVTNDLHGIAETLEAGVVRATLTTRKPKRKFFKRVLQHFDAPAHEIVMVGDKLFADVWGANRVGMKTVWVEHLGKDSLFDRITHLRRFQKRFLKHYR